MNTQKITLGVIVGNRGFFPAHLCKQILETLEKLGIDAILLDTKAIKFGTVESIDDAQKCAELVKQNDGKIDRILPNFGDEYGIANAIRWSGLCAIAETYTRIRASPLSPRLILQ